MKKSIMKKWVKALRSGEYKQGRFKLCDGNNYFCCLGVLTNLYVEENGNAKKAWKHNGSLSPIVQKWSGVNTGTGNFSLGVDSKSLANLNDTGVSFKDIADIIEDKYKSLC